MAEMTKEQILNSKKDRKFCILLYPDSESYNYKDVVEKIRLHYDYALITHDEDLWTEEDEAKNPEHKAGTLKKAHVHVVMRWSQGSGRYRKGLAKELGIPYNFIEPADKLDDALTYLIHFNHHDKHQYMIEEVEGNLVSRLSELINFSADGREEGESMMDLIEFISDYDGVLTTSEFMKYVIKTKQMNIYKKYSYAYHRMLDEHNFKYSR